MKWFFKTSLEIYTDGSQKGKWGSWAYVIVKKNKILKENSARILKSSSNEMEFQAAIEAIKNLPERSVATLYSDSKILIDTLQNKQDGPKNQSLQIQTLKELCLKHQLTYQWVKAHSGHIFNERCDQLCLNARKSYVAHKIS
jgi:ribonuclease HI